MYAARHDHDGERVKVLSAADVQEKPDGQDATASVVGVTIEPGKARLPHRRPAP